jgi:hypothetical protein
MTQSISTSPRVETNAIRQKAYELWLSGGRLGGVAEQNWLEAERMLKSTPAPASARPAPAAAAPQSAQSPANVPLLEKPIERSIPKSNPPAKRGR